MIEKCCLEWVIKTVFVSELQDTLNALEQDGYEIERFESLMNSYEGIKWLVAAWKPKTM